MSNDRDERAEYWERRNWLGEFWNARESQEFYRDSNPVAVKDAGQRIVTAIENLERLGVVKSGRPMPTLDEFEQRWYRQGH